VGVPAESGLPRWRRTGGAAASGRNERSGGAPRPRAADRAEQRAMQKPAGFVSVGITSDTAEFVVRSIRCWRERMGGARPTMIENFSRVCPAIGLSGLAAYRIGFPPNDIQRRGSDPSGSVQL
jgi:hypothetical protein